MGLCVLKVFHFGYAPCASTNVPSDDGQAGFIGLEISKQYVVIELARAWAAARPRHEPGVRGRTTVVTPGCVSRIPTRASALRGP